MIGRIFLAAICTAGLMSTTTAVAEVIDGKNTCAWVVGIADTSVRLCNEGGCNDCTPATGYGWYTIKWKMKNVPMLCVENHGWKQAEMKFVEDIPASRLLTPIEDGETISIYVSGAGSQATGYYASDSSTYNTCMTKAPSGG